MRYSYQENEVFLTADNLLAYRNKIWFTERDCNELYCLDLEEGYPKMVCKFDAEKEYQPRLFGGLIPLKGKLYAIPCAAEKLYEIDTAAGEVKGIALKEPQPGGYPQYMERMKFLSGHAFNDRIYLVPTTYPAIVEYDSATGEIRYYDGWIKEIEKECNKGFFRKSCMAGEKIYMPGALGNFVLEFDVETKRHRIFRVGSEKCAYSSICRKGELFWLSPRSKGPVVAWNPHTGEWREYWDFPDNYTPCLCSFSDIVCFEDCLYCTPMYGGMLIKITDAGKMQEYPLPGNREAKDLIPCIVRDEMYLFSMTENEFLIIDLQGNCRVKKLPMPKEQEKRHKKHLSETHRILTGIHEAEKSQVLYEDYQEALKEYLQFTRKKDAQEECAECGMDNGTVIYEELKRLL